MTDRQVWLITGAGRGLGVDIAKAALAAGHAVVATGRDPAKVTAAIGDARRTAGREARRHPRRGRPGRGRGRRRAVRPHRRAGQQRGQLLRRLLRGTQPRAGPQPDRDAAVRPDERHPRRAAGDAQAALGPVAHDLLDRRHHRQACSARPMPRRSSASKAGWSRSPRRSRPSASARCWSSPASSAPNCSAADSTTYAEPSIDDYAERTRADRRRLEQHGRQAGRRPRQAGRRPGRSLPGSTEPPARFAAGADAVQTFEAKAKTLLAQANAHRDLSSSLAFDDA